VKDGTIRFYPQNRPNLVFRHSGFVLFSNPYNPGDALQGLDSSFFPRPGNSDPNKISFESVNFPGRFLRHSGFRLFLHPKDGSPLFNADSSFELRNFWGDINNSSFFKSNSSAGWRPVGTWLSNAALGADGVFFGSNAYGNTYMRRTLDGPWIYLNKDNLKYLDCANAQQVVGTSFDGSVYRYKGGAWVRLPLEINGAGVGNGAVYSAVYASVNAAGRIGVVVNNGKWDWLYTTDTDRYLDQAGAGNWITLGASGAQATLTRSTSKVALKTAGGTKTIDPPAGTSLSKLFLSKSDGSDLLAVTTNSRLYGLDVHQKWSELPNPYKVDWAGLNGERILGVVSTAPNTGAVNIWTKQIKAAAQADHFLVVPNTVMNGVTTIPFTNKGLEQLKKECRETPGCVGFNYSKTSKAGTFVKGRETGPFQEGAMDGDWIGSSIPITFTGALSTGEKVYGVQSGDAKFVSASGVAKYFNGPVASFNPSLWNTYANAPGHYIAMVPKEYAYYRKTG
jgi:hypothetical protein